MNTGGKGKWSSFWGDKVNKAIKRTFSKSARQEDKAYTVQVEEVLTDKQSDRAMEFYSEHEVHVHRITDGVLKAYPPSLVEDKNDPRLWKPEYWNWFLAEKGVWS